MCSFEDTFFILAAAFFFVFWRKKFMRNIQLIGAILVVAGSFLPLVKIPVIGSWNYWEVEPSLAVVCWLFSAIALVGIFKNRKILVRFSAVVLLLLFGFTILATKQQSMDFFSFLPFREIQKLAAGTVKLGYGWILEFAGAALMLFATKSK